MKNVLTLILIGIFYTSSNAQAIANDKIMHFLAGASITSVTYIGLERFELKHNERIVISVVTGIVAGILKETVDSRRGVFDTKDLLATTMGSISIIIPIKIGRKKKRNYENLAH